MKKLLLFLSILLLLAAQAQGFDRRSSSIFGVPYLFHDEFNLDLAAGSVNTSSATPGPGTRTVTDLENKLSISSGNLTFSGGKTVPAWGDPGIWFPSITRSLGMLLIADIFASTYNSFMLGFDSNTNGTLSESYFYPQGTVLNVYSSSAIPVGTLVNGTEYSLIVALRTAGSFYFLVTNNIPELLYIASAGNTATLYPSISNNNTAFSSNFLRIPQEKWLPSPFISDGFGGSAGALPVSDGLGHAEGIAGGIGSGGGGVTWTGSTWTLNGTGKALNTPGTGTELITGWANNATYPYETFTTNIAALTSAINTTGYACAYKNVGAVALGQWYLIRFNETLNSGTAPTVRMAADSAGSTPHNLAVLSKNGFNVYSYRVANARASEYACLYMGNNITTNFSTDAVSLKLITPATLFSSVSNAATPNIFATAQVTIVAGTQAGLVSNLDSASNPQNFVIAYHDGTNFKLDKCVSGIYTNLINQVVTYSGTGAIRLVSSTVNGDLIIRCYYNNALIGSEITISDAEIKTNTLVGLFSTYEGNLFDYYTCYYRGIEGQWKYLNKFIR